MSCTLRRKLSRRLLERVLVPALTAFAAAFAHGQPAPTSIVFAINEGGSGNADAADILFRYQEFGEVVEKALRVKGSIVNARGRARLKENMKNHSYGLRLPLAHDGPRGGGARPGLPAGGLGEGALPDALHRGKDLAHPHDQRRARPDHPDARPVFQYVARGQRDAARQ